MQVSAPHQSGSRHGDSGKDHKEVIQYASLDKERFAEEIQSHIEDRQTVDFTEQRKRMTVCEKRIGELEMLIVKIYEDNALGKLSDKRYTMLYNQYEGEQEQQIVDYYSATDKYIRSDSHSDRNQTVFTKENDRYQWLVLEQKSQSQVEVRQTQN